MLKMSTIGRNACVQTFAQVVDSFVDRCLWQVTMKEKHLYNVNKVTNMSDMT